MKYKKYKVGDGCQCDKFNVFSSSVRISPLTASCMCNSFQKYYPSTIVTYHEIIGIIMYNFTCFLLTALKKSLWLVTME